MQLAGMHIILEFKQTVPYIAVCFAIRQNELMECEK